MAGLSPLTNAISQLTNSPASQNAKLWDFSIGGITLEKFEVPEEFLLGYEAHIVVHKYINESGRPVIKTHKLGVYPLPTSWKATFYYADAITKHQGMERLINSPGPFVWNYGPLSYLVDIAKYAGTVKHQQEIDYTIDLVVIESFNATIPEAPVGQNFDIAAQNFYDNGTAAAQQFLNQAINGIQAVSAQFTLMVNALQSAYPLRNQNFATLSSLAASIGNFLSALGFLLTSFKSIIPTEVQSSQMESMMICYNNFSLLQQALNDLIGVNTPDATKVTCQAGVSLFRLSAQFYPNTDPTQGAELIASANGMNDYFVQTNGTVLTIPPLFQ